MRLNRFYQLVSPIILFRILEFLLDNELMIPIFIIVTIFILLNLTNNVFFEDHDNFILEIGRFIGYLTLVFFTIFPVLKFLGSSNIYLSYGIVISILILSLHIRLMKYDARFNEFSYNKEPNRNRYYNTSNTMSYPKISNYALYRIEFYLLIILFSRYFTMKLRHQAFSEDIVYFDYFNIIFISIMVDIIIYISRLKFIKIRKKRLAMNSIVNT